MLDTFLGPIVKPHAGNMPGLAAVHAAAGLVSVVVVGEVRHVVRPCAVREPAARYGPPSYMQVPFAKYSLVLAL